MKRITLLLLLSVLLCLPIRAQEPQLRALRGLRGLVPRVSIESEDSSINRILPTATLQTDVELQLRKASLNVGTKADIQRQPLPPVLSVSVTGMLCDDLIIFNAEVSVLEEGGILRVPNTPLLVTTWSRKVMGSMTQTDAKYIRAAVRDLIDRFLNDWTAANSK